MLTTLRIQNMALIPAVEINFGPNFNVLTGETGAGKSIIIGSLNFIFGDKLSTNIIRQGADFARVTAVFDETIITRTLKADGKSEIRVNDEPMTLKGLREVAGTLIDIHGQHDTEKLLSPKNHLPILDAFGQIDLTVYQQEFAKLQALARELGTFGESDGERERLLDLYGYQIKEITQANITADEEEELQNNAALLRNAEKLREGLQEIVGHLEAADSGLGHAAKRLAGLTQYDARLAALAERLDTVSPEVGDIFLELRDYSESADFDEASLEDIYDRLDLIKNLKRKYGATVAEIQAYLEKITAEQNRLQNADETIQKLKAALAAQSAVVEQAAAVVTAARQKAAEQLQSALGTHLADLGMPNARFAVQFTAVPPKNNGADQVEFYFSANLGEDLRPLAQIISGGEMSRLMLAIKTVANTEPNKTLVFDEIDTGISGQMGVALAEKLRLLSGQAQIIVVTHLAAIAAAADRHFLIEKSVTENKTITNVYPLTPAARETEVARIIGGGETALAHAKVLLKQR